MEINCLRYWLHEKAGVTPYIMSLTDEHRRILAITSHMPAPILLSRSHPLSEQHATSELVNEDEGRTVIRAGDVEQAVWALWPEAVQATVGGDGKVHVFMDGGLGLWQQACAEALQEGLK